MDERDRQRECSKTANPQPPAIEDIASEILCALTGARRTGAERDEPEGSRYITLSDTLALKWTRELRQALYGCSRGEGDDEAN